jgi:steroid 5-alpha reductase family enzyme
MFTTEHLDWGASLVGKETKWRPAAATASPLFPTILHFVSIGVTETRRKTKAKARLEFTEVAEATEA